MSLLNAPDSTKNRKLKMKYDRVFIQGDQLTSINSETGAKGETETITFKRARDGTLYVDRYGSYIRKWRPEDGYIVINNAIGFYVKYTKMPKNIRCFRRLRTTCSSFFFKSVAIPRGHTRSYSYRNIIVRMEVCFSSIAKETNVLDHEICNLCSLFKEDHIIRNTLEACKHVQKETRA